MNREHCQLLQFAQAEVREEMQYTGAMFENDEVGLGIMQKAVAAVGKQGVRKVWVKESRYCARVILLYHQKMKDAGYAGCGLRETVIARCIEIRVNELTP